MPLTEDEKVRIRDHLAYLNASEQSLFVLGTPASRETQFMVERAFGFLIETAVPLVREILCELDGVRAKRKEVVASVTVASVGGVQMREPKEALAALDDEYERNKGRLANALGVPPQKFDRRKSEFGIPVG